ncbi:MAG: oligosaccharide flippase family protein [Eubacteriales bacterium]
MVQTNRSTALMIFPMIAGLAAIAPLFINVLLTDKWMPAVPFYLVCLEAAFYPMEATDLQANQRDRAGNIYLRSEIIKKTFGILVLAVSVFAFTSPIAIAWAVVATALFSMIVTMAYEAAVWLWMGTTDPEYSAADSALRRHGVGGLYGVSFLPVTDLPRLIIQIVCGVAVYIRR